MFVEEGAAPDAAASSRRFEREIVRMVVTLISACAGGLLVSRGASILELITFGCVFAALSAAVVSGMRLATRSSNVTFNLGVAAIVIVIFAAIEGREAASLVPGTLCALPFALSGYFFPRESSTDDAMYAGLAGCVLSLLPAMFVLFIACLMSLGIARVRKLDASHTRFFPYVAGFMVVGLVIQFALVA